MAKTKGAALISRIALIKEHHGEEALGRILARMKPEYSAQLNNMLFSSWYDANIFMDLNICIQKELGTRHPDISERMGELAADASLKGIYSSKLKEDNVIETLKRVPSIWKTFHDGGSFDIEINKDGKSAVMTVRDYPLPHPEFCANLLGWGRRLVELSGGQNAEMKKTKCVCKGDDCCVVTAAWK